MMVGPLRFDEENHEYFVGSRRIPGTHDVMEAAGVIDNKWRDEEALARGKAIHQAIQYDIEERLNEDSCTPYMMGFVEAARKAIRVLGIKVKKAEALVWCPKWQYATQIDLHGLWGGKPVVVNWKTGDAQAFHAIQSAGEAMCFLTHPQRLSVYLLETGDFWYTHHRDKRDFEVFKSALRINDWKARANQSVRPRQTEETITTENVVLPVENSTLFQQNPPNPAHRKGMFGGRNEDQNVGAQGP